MKTVEIKENLFKTNQKQRICELCKVGEMWNNKKLVLQIHHIDGNSSNNTFENLQIVCPNCHSQTSNFRVKKKITDEQWIDALNKSKTIGEAINMIGRHPSGALYRRIEKLLKSNSINHIHKYDYVSNSRLGTARPKAIIPEKNCPQCQKSFTSRRIFCSITCNNKARRKYSMEECYKIIEDIKLHGWEQASRNFNFKNSTVCRLMISRFIKIHAPHLNPKELTKFRKHQH